MDVVCVTKIRKYCILARNKTDTDMQDEGRFQSWLKGLVYISDQIDTDEAAEKIKNSIHFRGPNVWILAFSVIIASVGLNVNSTAVIIGAMLISPLMGPIMGLGLALAVLEDHVRDDEDDPREIGELPFHVIINPSYTPVGTETRSFYEGCLSFDGYQAVRKRWLDIDAEWDDENGEHHKARMHGWPARIFQHETDHLSGELYIDKAEIRSLTTYENLEDFWCEDPVPTEAAKELGFDL